MDMSGDEDDRVEFALPPKVKAGHSGSCHACGRVQWWSYTLDERKPGPALVACRHCGASNTASAKHGLWDEGA